jgi:hypothetical protein
MTFATHKWDYLKTKETWGAKSPSDKKIVAMLAALNALKGHLKLNDKLGDVIKGKGRARERDKVAIRRQRTRRTLETRPSRRRTKHGRRCLPRPKTRRARRWASTLTIGVSIIWHGACTCHLNVAWAKSRRRNSRRQSQPSPQTPPPMPPPLLQWLTRTSRLSLPPLAQLCRGGTKKNDGASQHAYEHIC